MADQRLYPRVPQSVVDWYAGTFESKNQGAEYALCAWQTLYRGTLARELRGVFAASELCLIVDVCNGLVLVPNLAGQQIQADIKDGITLDGLDQKWEITDVGRFLAKLRELNLCQAAVLEVWARAFWEQDGIKLAEWVAQIATPTRWCAACGKGCKSNESWPDPILCPDCRQEETGEV